MQQGGVMKVNSGKTKSSVQKHRISDGRLVFVPTDQKKGIATVVVR
jgi:hypothetical protein